MDCWRVCDLPCRVMSALSPDDIVAKYRPRRDARRKHARRITHRNGDAVSLAEPWFQPVGCGRDVLVFTRPVLTSLTG